MDDKNYGSYDFLLYMYYMDRLSEHNFSVKPPTNMMPYLFLWKMNLYWGTMVINVANSNLSKLQAQKMRHSQCKKK